MSIDNIETKSIKELSELADWELASLSSWQISRLTNGALFSENPYAYLFLGRLNAAQIQAVNPTLFSVFIWGFEQLPASFYSALTSSQLAAIDVRNLGYWGDSQLRSLSSSQFLAFSNAQKDYLINCINNKDTYNRQHFFVANTWASHFLASLNAAQVHALNPDVFAGGLIWGFEYLPASFYSSLTTTQIASIHVDNLTYWGGNQLAQLNITQAQALSNEQLKALIGESKLNIFDSNTWASKFLSYLLPSQLKSLDPRVFSAFIWGFEYLNPRFNNLLTTAQIAAIDARNLVNWGGEQLGVLDPEQIRALGYDQIKAITRDKQGLFDQNSWSQNFLSQLSSGQVAAIDAECFKAFIWGFEYLSPVFYRGLTNVQMAAINSRNLFYWNEAHIKALTAEQISGLSAAQIAGLVNGKASTWLGRNDWATDFLAKLNKAQLQAINPTFFSVWIYGFENLKNSVIRSFSQEQIAAIDRANLVALSGDQLGALAIEQVRALSLAQIKILTNEKNNPNLFEKNQWAAGFLGKLNAAQINEIRPGLFAKQIYDFENLPQEFYSALTTAQLAAIEPWNIQFWSGKQFSVLTSDQIQALTTTQIGYIAANNSALLGQNTWAKNFLSQLSAQQIKALSPSCLSAVIDGFELLPQHFYQALTPGQIAKIAPANIAYWGAAQWSLLTPEQIGQLSEAQIKAIGTKDASLFKENSWWTKDFLLKLSSTQVSQLSPQLFSVPIWDFERLPENFYQSLTGVQIAAIDGWNIQFWSGAQLKLLTAAQVQAFGQDQLERIGAQNLNLLGQNDWAKDFLAKLATNQVAKLNSKLFAAFVHGFERLSTDFYKALTPQQISAISQDNLAYWGAAQLSVLGQEQVSALSVDQVRRILNSDQNTLIFSQNNWTKDFLAKLNSDQIKALRPSLFSTLIYGFEYLSDSFYAALTNEQVAAIDARNLAYWGARQFNAFSAEQFGAISSAQIADLAKVAPYLFSRNDWAATFLGRLTSNQIKAISPSSLSVSIWGFEKLSLEFLKTLTPLQIAAILPENLYLWGADQLTALSAPQIQALTNQQVFALTMGKADLFKENSWAVNFLSALTSSQVKAIDPIALRTHIIGFNQISSDWNPSHTYIPYPFRLKLQEQFFSSLTPNQVAAISPESLCVDWGGAEMVLYANWFSAEQIKALTPAQIKAITNFQPNIFALDDGFDQSNNWVAQFLSQLSGEQIQAINTNAFAVFIPNLERLPEEFYKALTPGQIASIDPRNLTYWNATQLKSLDANQTRKLTAEQIKAVTFACDNNLFKENSWANGFLSLLDESQIKAIKPSLLATTIFGLEALPARFFEALTGAQIASLNFSQLPNWVFANVKIVTGDQISGIPITQLLKLSAIQVGELSVAQIAGITSAQYQALASNYVYRDIVQQIGMAGSWSVEQFGALSSEVIHQLTTQQIGELSAAQVQAIFANPNSSQNLVKAGQLNYWTQEQFSAISTKALQGFTLEQIANLSSTQFAIILQNEKLLQVILNAGKNTAGTMGWSAAQLAALPVRFIPQLTGLDISAIAALTAQQVGALSADQLANLVNNKPDILKANAWAKDFLAKLNSAQIKALKPSLLSVPIYDFENLPQEFYSALTTAQLAAIEPWNIQFWSGKQFSVLTSDQIQALTTTQIGYIGSTSVAQGSATIFKENEWAEGFLANLKSDQIRAIKPDCLSCFIWGMESLPQHFYQALTPGQIAKIAPANIAYWGAAQWSLLTPEQIGQLSEAQIKAIGTKDASLFKENSWAKDFLVKLNNAQIQALNPQLFADFIWGFESLSANFYNSLSDAQIKRLGVENIQYLSSQVLNYLKEENLKKFISSECITKLRPGTLNGLNEAHIAWLDQNDIDTFLKEPNLAAVLTNVGAVGSWTNAQIAALNSEAISSLGVNIQRFNIRAIANMNLMGVNEGQFCYLLPQQLNNLSDAQIEGLSAKQLKSILSVQELASVVTNIGSIGSWTRAQFNKINQSVLSDNKSLLEVIGINSMTNSAIASMSGDTLKKIVQDFEKAPIVTNVGAIGSWTNEQIAALSSDAINTLGLDIQRFNTRAISHMNLDKVNPSIFANLTAAQANQLTATQIAALTSAQYQALLAQPALAVVVNDLGAIGSWTRQQYDALSVAALQGFTLEQIANLSSTQFAIILQNEKLLQVILNAGKNTAGTMGWSAAQLAALPVRFIPQLTGLDISAIAALTAQQVGALSADQLANLVNNKPDILKANAWAKDFLAKLNSAQIKALKPSLLSVPIYDFENLPQEFYSALTTAQLAAIEPWNIQFWSGKQFSVLTSDQIQALTTTQIGYIGSTSVAQGSATIFKENEWAEGFLANLKSDQIRAIKPDCLSCFIWGMESLPQHFYQALTPGQIAKIAPANIAYWGAAQWSLLTPEQIGQLSEAQIKAIGTKDASLFKENSWAKDFLVKLNNAQIQALNPQLFAVPIYGFERLPENFYQSLTGVQIAAIDGWNIQFWSGAQFNALKLEEQFSYLTENQLKRANGYALSCLDIGHIQKLSSNQLLAIEQNNWRVLEVGTYWPNGEQWTRSQLQALGIEVLAGWSKASKYGGDRKFLHWFLKNLSAQQIKALDPALFSSYIPEFYSVTTEFYQSLSVEQIRGISAENVRGFTEWHISLFSESQLQALTQKQVAAINPSTLKHLDVTHIGMLTIDQIKAILSIPELMQVVLDVGAAGSWSRAQFSALNESVMSSITQNYMRVMDAETISTFSTDKIRLLTAKEIDSIPLTVISSLMSIDGENAWTKEQLFGISDETFLKLTKSVLRAIPVGYLYELTERALQNVHSSNQVSPGLLEFLDETQLAHIFKVVGVGNLSSRQVASISVGVLSTMRDPYLVSAISNLRITQLSDLSNQQIEALRGNINLVVGSNSDLDRIIKLTTTLTQPALGKIADSSAAFDGLPDDIKLALVNTRNIYVFITLLRAVWGSQHIYKQASVEQLLSEYEKNLHSNNMNSTGRHQYQVLRGIYGGAGSWGTAASYLYQASVADNAKDQAKNALQGISYFLTSLKPLSSIVGMLKKLGVADSYNTLRGRALTVIELSSDPILNGDGLEDYTKKKLSLTEFQSLEKSAQSYFIYQTSTTDIYGEVTHIYIQKAASSSYDNLTLADEVRQKKTKAYLGLNVDIGATMDYRGLSLGSGKVVYEDGIVAIHRTENLKHFRENYKVQMLADAFSIGNYVFNLATTKQDGSSDAAKANVQNSIGLVASTLNLLSDFGNPSYWDSAPAELKAKYASPAQRIASTAFAVSNLLNDVASLTIAIMDVVALEKKGGASTGEKIGVYGNLSVVGLLSVLSFIAMVQPEFAPFVFVAGLLAPNFSAIGQAKDIRQKQLDLLAKEQYTYATYIMEPLLHAAIQSSLPIASWFAVLISSQVIRDISDTMARNNHKLVWDAIEEMHNYEQLNSSDAKGRLKAIGDAIFASQNTWDAVLINVAKIADSQFYVTDGRILTYATALTVFHGGSNLAPKLDLYKASLDGVADGEEEIVNVVFGANDGRKAINSIVSGDQNIELFIDASNFVDGTMGKSNSFEIQKSNVTIKGNSESQFLIDLGLVRDLSTIKMVGDALSAKNVVKLEDVTGCLSELKLNLDQFKIEAGGSLSVGGLYSKNFETSYIAGTLENQIYTFGGGMDNVSMTGGRGIATIGGAGSSLIMAKGHNTANVVMDIGDLKKGAGKYDGGLTENKGYNMIDFSVTYGDDLVFIETQNDSNEEVSWTSVYGYLKTPDSAQTFKTDALGGIDINQSAHPLYVGSAVDAGQFTHFDILHTGFNSNYIQLAGNTNISQIYLDGTEKNVLNFNASSINNATENQMIDIHSAVTGKSEIYLGPNALKSASVTGRGGDLLVNADRYDGDMILDLMNTGANSTTFSKLFGVGASRIDINGGGGGKFIFNLGSYASTYIDVKYAGSSVIDISQHAEMTDNASLHIDSGFELKSMEFAISGNRLFSAYLDDQHELHQLMTLDFGMASNQDNIFLQDGDGRNESMSYLMSLDSLVHAMATINANGGSSSGRYFNGSAYYAADDLWKAISRSA